VNVELEMYTVDGTEDGQRQRHTSSNHLDRRPDDLLILVDCQAEFLLDVAYAAYLSVSPGIPYLCSGPQIAQFTTHLLSFLPGHGPYVIDLDARRWTYKSTGFAKCEHGISLGLIQSTLRR
jgi:hypothetical protein